MRKVLIAALIAAGLGFVGSASVSAAPVNGTIINEPPTFRRTTW